MKFRKKPIVIDAYQWFKNGDHPGDDVTRGGTTPDGTEFEGLVVRYFRNPFDNPKLECAKCGDIMHNHGWIDTFEGGHIVCPGDWIITGVAGERYPCKPDVFEATYEHIDGSSVKKTILSIIRLLLGVLAFSGIAFAQTSNVAKPLSSLTITPKEAMSCSLYSETIESAEMKSDHTLEIVRRSSYYPSIVPLVYCTPEPCGWTIRKVWREAYEARDGKIVLVKKIDGKIIPAQGEKIQWPK